MMTRRDSGDQLMSSYPKGQIGGKDVFDDPRLDACQDAIDNLHRRADAVIRQDDIRGSTGPDHTLTTPGRGRSDALRYGQRVPRAVLERLALQGEIELQSDLPVRPGSTVEIRQGSKRLMVVVDDSSVRTDAEEKIWRGVFSEPGSGEKEQIVEVRARGYDAAVRALYEEKRRRGIRPMLSSSPTIVRSDSSVRTDPPVSEAQRRFMRFAAEHPGEAGVSREVSEEFNEADPGGRLPERKDETAREAALKALVEDLQRRGVPPEEMKKQIDAFMRSSRADATDPEDHTFYAGEHRGDQAVMGANSGKPYCYHDSREDAQSCADSRNRGGKDCS